MAKSESLKYDYVLEYLAKSKRQMHLLLTGFVETFVQARRLILYMSSSEANPPKLNC